MEPSINMTDRIVRKSEKIKLKYRYDNNRLKGNRKILEAKIFSPQRQSENQMYQNELLYSEYSLNGINSNR